MPQDAMTTPDPRIQPLVLGAGGRLGTGLQEALSAYPSAVFATRHELDVTDPWRLAAEVERLAPTVVVNAASFTHVDGCEDDPHLAEKVNRDGARNAARAARQAGARLIQISTDLVFDGGLDRPYTERDAPHPISVYGRTKHEGELAVLEECPEACVLRASWFFGPGERKFPENFLAEVAARRPLALVDDRFGSPTYVGDLAAAVEKMIRRPYEGLLHFTNTGQRTTRYHFIRLAAERSGLDTAGLRGVSRHDWKGDRAPRPVNSALDPSEYVRVTGETPRSWLEALDAYLATRPAARGVS